jgi:carboxymethylenebutenolidase
MGQTIKLKAADGHRLSTYEVSPAGKSRGGLAVIQEIFGVNAHMRHVAEGFAAEGYHVVAPALFDRAEPGIELGYDKPAVDRGKELREKIPLDATLADIAAALERLKASGKAAIVGYCWGGSIAWIAAARLSGLAASVGYYGGMIAGHLADQPRCPVMLHFGEEDSGIPMSDVAKIKAAVDPATVQVFTYAGAGHAFNRDGNASFHAPSAKPARERTLAFFRKHVG